MYEYENQCNAIIAALGGEVKETESCWCMYFTYDGFSGMIKHAPKKFVITVFCPHIDRSVSAWHAEENWKKLTTSIGVGETKTPEQIAADIKRRFDWEALKDGVKQFEAAVEASNAAANKHKELAAKVADWTGLKPRNNDDPHSTTIYLPMTDGAGYGDIKIHNQSVEFNIRSVSSQKLVQAICQAIKTAVQAEK